MQSIEITLNRPAHSYEILFQPGLIQDWRQVIEERFQARGYLLLVDKNIVAYHNLPPDRSIRGDWRTLHVLPGEEHKNLEQYASLSDRALHLAIDRDTVLVALGGGVTGDIAGFVASTLLRGIRLVQVPTTLVAQVDSSVGGKNGVNAPAGKNLIGTFHQPSLVLVDPAFLDSLPRREYLAGVAEIVKTAIIDSRDFFDDLRRRLPALKAANHDNLRHIIRRCCQVKADIVTADERDTGKRQLLNLGHTFGHVLESLAGFNGSVVHGEAVAVGTVLACDFAVERGDLCAVTSAEIRNMFAEMQLPTTIRQLGAASADAAGGAPVHPLPWGDLLASDAALSALTLDKKASEGRVNLVLPHDIGDCRVEKGFPAEDVLRYMREKV